MKKEQDKDELKKAVKELENSIKSNDSIEEIYKKSSEIDNIVILKLNKCLRYERMLALEDKNEIIKSIKQDILSYVSDISINELENISYTMYVFCVLKAYEIEQKDIFDYIEYINNKRSPKACLNIYDKGEELKKNFYSNIYEKYINVVKERIIKYQ